MSTIHIRKSKRNGRDGRVALRHRGTNKSVPTYCGAESSHDDIGQDLYRHHVDNLAPVMRHPQCPQFIKDLEKNLCGECRAKFPKWKKE